MWTNKQNHLSNNNKSRQLSCHEGKTNKQNCTTQTNKQLQKITAIHTTTRLDIESWRWACITDSEVDKEMDISRRKISLKRKNSAVLYQNEISSVFKISWGAGDCQDHPVGFLCMLSSGTRVTSGKSLLPESLPKEFQNEKSGPQKLAKNTLQEKGWSMRHTHCGDYVAKLELTFSSSFLQIFSTPTNLFFPFLPTSSGFSDPPMHCNVMYWCG